MASLAVRTVPGHMAKDASDPDLLSKTTCSWRACEATAVTKVSNYRRHSLQLRPETSPRRSVQRSAPLASMTHTGLSHGR